LSKSVTYFTSGKNRGIITFGAAQRQEDVGFGKNLKPCTLIPLPFLLYHPTPTQLRASYNKPMTINVLFFASLREKAGRGLEYPITSPLTLRDLAAQLEKNHTGLFLNGTLCAINEQYADPETLVNVGDTVAFFPPVSGG
jgi:sulfur-carrier protein